MPASSLAVGSLWGTNKLKLSVDSEFENLHPKPKPHIKFSCRFAEELDNLNPKPKPLLKVSV